MRSIARTTVLALVRLAFVCLIGTWAVMASPEAAPLNCNPTPCVDCGSRVCDPDTLTCVDCGFGVDCTCPNTAR